MLFDRFSHQVLPFRQVLAFTVTQWRRTPSLLVFIFITVVAWTLSDVLMPFFAGRLIDAVASPGVDRIVALHSALWSLGAMAGLGLALVAGRYVTFLGITRLTLGNMTAVTRDTFARVQRLSADWQANTFAGSTVRKVSRGMWAFDTLNDTLLMALLPSMLVLVATTALLGLRWPLMGAIIAVGAIAAIIFAAATCLGYVAPAAQLSNEWDSRLGGVMADAITCNAVVKSFGAEVREEARLDRILAKWSHRTRRQWIRGNNSGSAQAASLLVLRTSVVSTSLWLWWVGRATPGDVTWVLTTYFVVHGYLRDMGQHIAVLQRSVNDMHEMVLLNNEAFGVLDRPQAPAIHVSCGEIVFACVCFSYAGQIPALYEDFSLRVQPGERVGLVGRSGSGKTTLIKLIGRLHDVTGGQILIDGQNIADVTQASLRSQIAVVQQDPMLFHRSIAENISYGQPSATQGAIEHAARLANAHDFIIRLPKGYGTLVGERGIKLSGGERQRVALARAFLADAPILILDEATSSLDSESESLIQDSMLRLMQGRTAIVIAHRLSTVRALDRIIVLEQGSIAEEGTHEALLDSNGLYRHLFTTQALGLMETA